jgi:transmembrane sensor
VHRPQASGGPGGFQDVQPAVTPEIAADAAVWVARLHGPDRSSRMERDCLAWQARSAAHRMAFERCTDTWQDVSRVSLSSYATATSGGSMPTDGRRPWLPAPRRWALVLTALVSGGVLVLQPWRDVQTYTTGVGEQQMVVLRDGTRMSLNTATRVRVELAPAQRTVSVEGGEALFEVAKDARRPFVVRVAGAEVVALGTVFSVRLAPGNGRVFDSIAVTLIEGQVTVRAASDDAEAGALTRPVLMAPGERVRLIKAGGASTRGAQRATTQVDRPRMDQVLAWKRNEAVFEDVALSDAVAEMNRYSRTPIVVVGDSVLSGLRVSGLFRTGDNAGFARAVAALHGLVVRERSDRLELAPK